MTKQKHPQFLPPKPRTDGEKMAKTNVLSINAYLGAYYLAEEIEPKSRAALDYVADKVAAEFNRAPSYIRDFLSAVNTNHLRETMNIRGEFSRLNLFNLSRGELLLCMLTRLDPKIMAAAPASARARLVSKLTRTGDK